MKDKLGIGVVGCGVISKIYMTNCLMNLKHVFIASCTDSNIEAAKTRAEEFGCRFESLEALLQNDEVDIILNLTPPAVHFEITMKALEAGKHVYSEKPFCSDLQNAKTAITYAKQHGLFIGCAPDCIMGAGIQEVKKILNSENIGKPFAVQSFMFSRGPESFHPNPIPFYQEGVGPIFDWGPYYIAAITYLLGAVDSLYAFSTRTTTQRTVLCKSSNIYGKKFSVKVPTYVTCILKMKSGVLVSLSLSFDMYNDYNEQDLPFIRIYGSKGSIDVPDPNMYSCKSIRVETSEKTENINIHKIQKNLRGIGLDEMANAIINGGLYHVNADFVLHVTEVLCKMEESCIDGKEKRIESVL